MPVSFIEWLYKVLFFQIRFVYVVKHSLCFKVQFIHEVMPFKCNIIDCKGNYVSKEASYSCSLFRLPKDLDEQKTWTDVIPHFNHIKASKDNFRICRSHWPANAEMVSRNGKLRPKKPPSLFNVPKSSLPTHKPPPRPAKMEFANQAYLDRIDKFASFDEFSPVKKVLQKYKNVLYFPTPDKIHFIFMTEQFSASEVVVTVHNKSTLTCPVTFEAFKYGNKITVPRGILSPNSGFSRYSQFMEAINFVIQYNIPTMSRLSKVADILEDIQNSMSPDHGKYKKVKFITRQVQLLSSDRYTMADYCFAIENYPSCKYRQLRDFLILPCQRTIQTIISSTDVQNVLYNLFQKVSSSYQKYCFLIVDEVKIRPTVSYSGGVLHGLAKNDTSSKASSILAIMAKCLHGGPSVMIRVVPVHKMTAEYQFLIVKETAGMVEAAGGFVIGSITDNHKINQKYCNLFTKKTQYEAYHPLDNTRSWFLLFDTVHLLKCLRNNWITEASKQLTLDGKIVGKFSDVQELYEEEKHNIFRTTSLTSCSVYPSRLELQNVKHVVRVFCDQVVASLRLQNKMETAHFIESILIWWKTVNVKSKGEETRFNDWNRAVQQRNSSNLQGLTEMFEKSSSGFGSNRIKCLTHDTRKAMLQTMSGLSAVCTYLFDHGFEYVLLGDIQSDRIEAEFSIYRYSTGANAFMVASDVLNAYKKRLAKFAASYLNIVQVQPAIPSSHVCLEITVEDAYFVEASCSVELSTFETYSSAYIAGWLERKCPNLEFGSDDFKLDTGDQDFIEEVSRGKLTVPHNSTYQFVRSGLCYVKEAKSNACCQKKLIKILELLNQFYDFGCYPHQCFQRLANVLLRGFHNVQKDLAKNNVMYQTTIKKARLSE